MADEIILGLVSCGAYCALRLRRHGSLDVTEIFLVSVAGFALPTGATLVKAAFLGDCSQLPQDWRVYVAAGGLVVIGLPLQYIINAFRSVVAKRPEHGPSDPAP